MSKPFSPDWVSPPGETILDIAEERGWTQAELARQLGYTEEHVGRLAKGEVEMDTDAALSLVRLFGGTTEFWMAREANFQKHKARLEFATA